MRLGPWTSGSRLPPVELLPPSLLLQPTSATSASRPAAHARRQRVRVRGLSAVILTRLRGRLHQREIHRARSPPPVLSATGWPESTASEANPGYGAVRISGAFPACRLYRRHN